MADLKNILYFNSTRTNTLALLDGFNNIKHWVKDENGDDVEKVVPISFGNYEKSQYLEDIGEEDLKSGKFNVIPRLVLSFNGMTKAPERTTSKYQKISKTVTDINGKTSLNFGYNSVPYNFQYTLTVQARGLNQAFMLVEQILPRFRPSYYIGIKEYPLFDDKTETQLLIEDPQFEILEEFQDTDVNIVNVTFGLDLRGNLYMPLQISAPIKIVTLMNHLWDNYEIKESQLARHYEWEVCPEDALIYHDNLDRIYAPHKLVVEPAPIDVIVSPCVDECHGTKLNTEEYSDITSVENELLTTELPIGNSTCPTDLDETHLNDEDLINRINTEGSQHIVTDESYKKED